MSTCAMEIPDRVHDHQDWAFIYANVGRGNPYEVRVPRCYQYLQHPRQHSHHQIRSMVVGLLSSHNEGLHIQVIFGHQVLHKNNLSEVLFYSD